MFPKIVFYIVLFGTIKGQSVLVKYVLVHNIGQEQIVTYFEEWLKTNEIGSQYDVVVVALEEEGRSFEQLCNAFSQGGTIILDISYSGYDEIREVARNINVPFIKIDVSISPYLKLLDKYLDARNSTDVALVFEDPSQIDQALYYWIDTTRLRMVITEKLDEASATRLRDMRPSPNNYALLATTNTMNEMYKQIGSFRLLNLAERWNLLFLDFQQASFSRKNVAEYVNLIYPSKAMCCALKNEQDCECSTNEDMIRMLAEITLTKLAGVLEAMSAASQNLAATVTCNETNYDEAVQDYFYKSFTETVIQVNGLVYEQNTLRIKATGSMEIIGSGGDSELVAKYNEVDGLDILTPEKVKPVKAFYRIGTTTAIPWSFQETDPMTGELRWTGYCIDFADKLSELLNFDYELVVPKTGTFGNKDPYGNWDGIIGDLSRGETDIALAALTMTADREEVVDFVPPYFEQVGISIVMRKPVRKTSLFKFMTVLKLEVWMSIIGALVVTALMVWFLDKYSPYSARNNKKAYPYPCREFTLKESFWFALTSFTPQGGGEAPKALSGRTLVAAYWLFVVLMLATFTANLAAFLTVERMQTPVQSLEQLARQSRINYTVVEGSEIHKYFINMKFAEDTLYRLWKELTLNASTDETQYRVWDYPIREQYGQILIAINDSMPVESAEEGFTKVNERLDADFAFIHDSSVIKYEISRNCNFTEVGDVFGERPYALAVQQGSHLQDAISIKILDLQRDRFFESLQAKYWNQSAKGSCDNADDNEGITLESLGGVFIATLFGLALAMVTLAGEVFYYKRKQKVEDLQKQKLKVKSKGDNFTISKFPKAGEKGSITIGEAFKPVTDKDLMRVSHIALYPRVRNRLPNVD